MIRTVASVCRMEFPVPPFFFLAILLFAPMLALSQGDFGNQAVGVSTNPQNVTVTLTSPGIVASVQVLTSGAPGLDFAPASLGACVSTAFPGSCTVSVTFTPAVPGLRAGAIVLMDADRQTVLGTAWIHGIGSGGLGILTPGNILPIAGDGEGKSIPVLDGISGQMAELDQPSSVALDGLGNLYIADVYHHRIRMVCGGLGATITGTVCAAAQAGLISTIAGNGIPAYTGDGALAASASLNSPAGIALDGAGNLYIADTVNNVIRKITAATGIITTVVGFKNAEGAGASGYGGDGGPATAAILNTPWGVTFDAFGNLFVADTFNHRIRRIDPLTDFITTIAGTGIAGYNGDGIPATSAALNLPYAVAFDAAQNMYIPDSANNRVRMVSPSGTISTFAGSGAIGFSGDGSAPAAAELWSPSGVVVDAGSNVYIADTQNSAIRKVSSGVITTVAQNDVGIYLYNGGGPYPVSIYWPWGMTLDGQGNLYFADFLNLRVREIQGNVSPVDFTRNPIRQGYQSKPATIPVQLENDGNTPLDTVSISPGANSVIQQSALDPTLEPCVATGQTLQPDQDCWIDPVFAPAATPPLTSDQIEFGNINIVANSTSTVTATNSPLQVEVVGIATPVNSTTTSLSSNPNPSGFGQTVIFTATVNTGAGTGNLSGGVAFYDGATLLGPSVPMEETGTPGQEVAAYTISTLIVGTHTIKAVYDNTKDPDHFTSSATLSQAVLEGTVTTLSASEPIANVGDTVVFTATVAAANGGTHPLDGSVTFVDGSTILCTQNINASGVAACSTSALTQGINQITATYTPASTNEIQPSIGVLALDVQAGSTVLISLGIQAQANSGIFYGNPVNLIATVNGGGAITSPATGTVFFFDGTQQIGKATLSGVQAQGEFITTSLAVGSHAITASYQGDANYKASVSTSISVTVNQAQTAAAVTALPASPIAGAPAALFAAVTVTQGVANPTGTVTFTSNGVAIGSKTVASGTAAISPIFAPGIQSIVATYSGDTNSSGTTSVPLSLQVLIATATATVTSSADPAIVFSPVTFSAKVSGNGGTPTGSVTFSADGAAIGSATLDATGSAGVSYSGLAVASHTITVSYSGDTNDAPATSAAITQVVGTISTATALGESSTGGTAPGALLVATVVGSGGPTPTGTVTFTIGTTTLGAAPVSASGIATLAPNPFSGTETVIASYGGDTIHGPSVSQPIQVSGVPIGFQISVTPSTVSIPTGKSATLSVTLASISGFADTIGLGCATVPATVNCHFSAASVALAANGAQTVQLTLDTGNPLGDGATARNAATKPASIRLAGISLPIAVLFGVFFWRLRRRLRSLSYALSLLLLAAGALLINGCGGFSQISAAVGSYTIQVTGTGANSDIEHYQNVVLTVTQ